ncbi:antibiotic biosynthesis monooxygenase [Enterobacter sp. Cy-643]|uniref:putative quinol monooxygenase n=1 Tax=Enterobacter sp. Cy-643 TaxID=2608346 RepID=UPI00142143F4|nr:putative quinol monooxygenase [Enterobacter sp. Cy-643]NIF31183.1 antibiotic biosynthesis monooxygenase [Enterobacter sp. Cy-643]
MATTETLTIIAMLKAKAGQQDNLKAALKALGAPSRLEPGCLDYTLFQLQQEPDTFFVRESWRGQQALDLHNSLPHFQAFVKQMDGLLAEPLKLVPLDEVAV